MIFVTVGTQKIRFNRLYEYLKDIKDEVIIQEGYNNWDLPSNFKIYKFISYNEMNKYLNKADVIITHGGPYNIFYGLKKGKKVIVVPRMKKYKEHINDHQLIFANYLKKSKICYVATNKEEFEECLNKKQKLTKYKSNTNKFTKNIQKEIDDLLNN